MDFQFLSDSCDFNLLTHELISTNDYFDCGNTDLNEFFSSDFHDYNNQLLGRTYCFTLKNKPIIVCAFTVANASLNTYDLPNSRVKKVRKNIPHIKHSRNYPAVLIGRLGVNKLFRGKHIGDELMNFIKLWFLSTKNKTGCRFISVDAYNTEKPLKYYERNNFTYLFSNEQLEKNYLSKQSKKSLDTRLMYFDLITAR